ncbi:MAG: hypothetical protein NUW01_17445 [Gemmatimonadaceae bacterium]|nr:hypothetical protein [Gemmatimonadaceae bacterium]
MEQITLWQVITLVFIPVIGGGFLLLYRKSESIKAEIVGMITGMTKRLDEDGRDQWAKINQTAADLAKFQLDAERRFAKESDMKELIQALRADLKTIDEKLDYLAGTRPMPRAGE